MWQQAAVGVQSAHRSPRRIAWSDLCCAAMIVGAVAATQLAQGSYRNDLATHPDEAAHFVTAMCLLDYARTALGSNPVRYAESYYAHYPKVAFGHWPPGFFGIQALWYGIFGGTVPAGMLLVGVIAALAALTLFTRLRSWYGIEVAVLSVAVYLALPVVWKSSSALMSDTLASLLEILAVLAFCDGCVTRSWQRWGASALWGGLAVLTKESALSLFLSAPIALM
ncbi:MAG TPA: glycosyltransferase family 39 protein, partial [Vicinamibacterales bacterium]|nr:glycosyltransferase family 39 protein [Vicinamibacterales bacterium]